MRSAHLNWRRQDEVQQEGDLLDDNLATKKGNIFNFRTLSVKT